MCLVLVSSGSVLHSKANLPFRQRLIGLMFIPGAPLFHLFPHTLFHVEQFEENL